MNEMVARLAKPNHCMHLTAGVRIGEVFGLALAYRW